MSLRSILDYVRYFILFEQDGDGLIKKIAGYHQFHGVREAVRVTLIASATEDFSKVKEDRATYGKEVVPGSKKAGVCWHTQGSGKSISMCCYAGKLLQQPEMEKKNLAVELLERLLQGKIKAQTRTNLVQEKKYSDRLIEALRKYHNRMIESSQVIEEMIQMAKDMQEAMKRHEELGLNPDEEAFYDALADRPEVLLSMGDATLKKLASELTEKLRNSTTVDWQFRESVRAKMRILIRQLLRKYKYPPEGCEEAIGLVLAQAQALADDWTGDRIHD